VRQYVVGGFEVAEKIDATEAYDRFPRLRLHLDRNGNKVGNIIVDQNGGHSPLDDHDGFEQRVENYIVGRDPVVLTQSNELVRARVETLDFLQRIFGRDGPAPINIIGRCSRLDEDQIEEIRRWLIGIKRAS